MLAAKPGIEQAWSAVTSSLKPAASIPAATGFMPATRLPFVRSAVNNPQVTAVLPTPVSVPVIKQFMWFVCGGS